MATSVPPSASSTSAGRTKYELTVNSYDRTATLLVALLIIVGLGVAGLMVVFFANRTFPTIQPIPIVPVEATAANENQGLAQEPELILADEPIASLEMPDLTVPQLQDTLDALASAAATREVLLSDESLDAQKDGGKGESLGDSRLSGPTSDGDVERVPRWQRWKIRFQPESEREFAEWLDFHKIEIGVLGRDNLVHYAFDLSAAKPGQRSAKPTTETRFYTSSADGPMPALTLQLAQKADVARHGAIVLLFYPFEVESVLWTLEQQQAEGRDVNSIRQTVFTVTRDRRDFGFRVIDQKFF